MHESQSSKRFGPSTTSHSTAIIDERQRNQWRGEAVGSETSWPFWRAKSRGHCSTKGVTWEITQVNWETGHQHYQHQLEMDDVQRITIWTDQKNQLYPSINLCLFILSFERLYFKIRPLGRNVYVIFAVCTFAVHTSNLHTFLVPSSNPAFAVHAPNLADF